MLKNAPILVLDEATSALDSEVEASIQESLKTLMKDKTVIAIAHRLSTIAAMDRLVVLDQGQIVEQGTHSELVNAGGIYAKLWSHQTGGFWGSNEIGCDHGRSGRYRPRNTGKGLAQMQGSRVAYGDVDTLAAAAERWAPDLRCPLMGPKISPIGCGRTHPPLQRVLGSSGASAGASSFDALALAVEHALSGQVQGVVTAPINKAAWHKPASSTPGIPNIWLSVPSVRSPWCGQ